MQQLAQHQHAGQQIQQPIQHSPHCSRQVQHWHPAHQRSFPYPAGQRIPRPPPNPPRPCQQAGQEGQQYTQLSQNYQTVGQQARLAQQLPQDYENPPHHNQHVGQQAHLPAQQLLHQDFSPQPRQPTQQYIQPPSHLHAGQQAHQPVQPAQHHRASQNATQTTNQSTNQSTAHNPQQGTQPFAKPGPLNLFRNHPFRKEFFESIERIPEWFDILETKGTICLELRSPDRLERYMELLLILSNLPDLAYEQRLLRSQTVRPWTKEWHDPDEGWPTALQRKNGGWWRCRDGPDATLPELMCGVCRGLRRSSYYEDWVQIHDDLERDRTEQLTLYLSEIRKAQAEAHKKEALKFKWRMQYEDQMRKEQQRQAVLSRYVRNQMLGDPGVNWLNHTPRAGRGLLGKASLKTRAQLLREVRAAWYAMARGDPSSMIFRKICSIASQSSAHARARSLQERLYPETKSPILAAGKQQALQQFQICFLSQTNSFLKKRSSGEQNTKRQSQAQASETGLFQIQHHEDVQAESSAMAETRARMKAKWSFQVHKDDDEPVQDNPAIIPYNFPEDDEAPNASPEKDKDKASIRAQFDSQKQSKTRVELPKKAKTDNRVRFAEPEVSNTHVFTSLPLVEPEEEQTPTHSSDHRSLELERIPPRPILKPGGFKGKGKAKSVTWALP